MYQCRIMWVQVFALACNQQLLETATDIKWQGKCMVHGGDTNKSSTMSCNGHQRIPHSGQRRAPHARHTGDVAAAFAACNGRTGPPMADARPTGPPGPTLQARHIGLSLSGAIGPLVVVGLPRPSAAANSATFCAVGSVRRRPVWTQWRLRAFSVTSIRHLASSLCHAVGRKPSSLCPQLQNSASLVYAGASIQAPMRTTAARTCCQQRLSPQHDCGLATGGLSQNRRVGKWTAILARSPGRR